MKHLLIWTFLVLLTCCVLVGCGKSRKNQGPIDPTNNDPAEMIKKKNPVHPKVSRGSVR